MLQFSVIVLFYAQCFDDYGFALLSTSDCSVRRILSRYLLLEKVEAQGFESRHICLSGAFALLHLYLPSSYLGSESFNPSL